MDGQSLSDRNMCEYRADGYTGNSRPVGAAGLISGRPALAAMVLPGPLVSSAVPVLIAVVLLMVVPPVASGDPVFYAAYGRIAGLGRNPYVTRPVQLLAPWDSIR